MQDSLIGATLNREIYSQVELLTSAPSTNVLAQERLAEPDPLRRRMLGELSLIATGNQTRGRGRLDRAWIAPAETALATSFIVRPHAAGTTRLPAGSYHWLTMVTALAAVRTLEELGVAGASIKWPNDVLVEDRKICGILAHLVTEPEGQISLVVGIGMNLNLEQEDLPVPTATSVLLETGQRVELARALEILSENFATGYCDFARAEGDPQQQIGGKLSLLDSLRSRLSTLGQEVNVHLPDGSIQVGCALDINEEGELVVCLTDGELAHFAVGDVVHLRPQQG